MSNFTPPKSYTAYAFKEKGGKLEKIAVDWKDPKAGEVVVKVLACGVCASDEIVKEQQWGVQLPRIPGHEIVGTVVAIPPTEKKWKTGQRVGGGWHGGHCHECTNCRAGDYVVCDKEDINGINRDGGYAEYATLRTEAIAAIPEGLDSAEAAPLLCAGVTTFNSLRHMDVHPGDVVAVQGIGGLGHLAVQFARKMGYRTVALSSSDSKRQLAADLGAQEYIDSSKVDQAETLSKLGGAKVIVCTAPSPEAIQSLIHGLAVGGQLLVLALTPGVSIPLGPMIAKRLSVRGWPFGTARDSEETMEFADVQGVKAMVTSFPLEKAQEAYDHRASARFRAVIVPGAK